MIILLLLASLSGNAAPKECFRYELSGAVKQKKSEIILITHEGTQSQRIFHFSHQDIPKLAPYMDKHVRGEFILPLENPVSGTKVISAAKLDFAVPDPLHHERAVEKSGKVPCP